jgi:hypothetical protein
LPAAEVSGIQLQRLARYFCIIGETEPLEFPSSVHAAIFKKGTNRLEYY